MTLEDLDILLSQYNEDELTYREYFLSKSDPVKLKSFINSLNIEEVKSRRLIIPEANTSYNPYYIKDEDYFFAKNNNNIVISKHNRYTPIFSHSHSFLEMIYVYSGNLNQKVSDYELHLNKGDVCIIPPDVNHSISVFDDSIIINILIKKSTFNDMFFKVISDGNVLSDFFSKILYSKSFSSYIVFRSNDDQKLKEILCNLIIENLENKKYSDKIQDNLLMLFYGYLLRCHEDHVELPGELHKSAKYISSILAYILTNSRTVSLKDISKEFHFTIPYLSKIIKLNTGSTFKDIIQSTKLRKAQDLLSNSNISICKISEIIGYENTTHFIRTFNKVYGVSPNQYRKEIKSKNIIK